MTTYATDDLQRILALHRKWLYGEPGGERAVLTDAVLTGAVLTDAVLTGAVLTGADLTGAVLTGAVLTGAVLTGADLTGAVLTGALLTGALLTGAVLTRARLSDGVTWGEYLSEVVPALLTAGGRPLEEVATPDVWACHTWQNCPMHAAFGADSLDDVPALHRWQAGRFVQFYDAKLIPLPTAPAAPTPEVAA